MKIPLSIQSQTTELYLNSIISCTELGIKSIASFYMKLINPTDLDGCFEYTPSVGALVMKGLYTNTFIKKHAHLPRYMQAEEVLQEIEGKEVGIVRVQKGMYTIGDREDGIYLFAIKFSLHNTDIYLLLWNKSCKKK